MVITFGVMRVYLHRAPDADLNIGSYNVHHLFTGLLLIAAGGIPLALFRGHSRRMDGALVIFAIGLTLALDEWVYLIATDGSNASYLLPVSLVGALVMIGAACLYAIFLAVFRGWREGRRQGRA